MTHSIKPVDPHNELFWAHIKFRRELRLLIAQGKYSPQLVDQLRIKYFGSVAAYWS